MTQWAEIMILNVFSLLRSLRRLVAGVGTIICRFIIGKQRQNSAQLNFKTINRKQV